MFDNKSHKLCEYCPKKHPDYVECSCCRTNFHLLKYKGKYKHKKTKPSQLIFI